MPWCFEPYAIAGCFAPILLLQPRMPRKRREGSRPVNRRVQALEADYQAVAPLASRFADEVSHQLQQLIDSKGIVLSLPLQRRIKSWPSIREKIERKSLDLANIKDLNDLVGLRAIVQFTRDLSTVRNLVKSNFAVIEEYDSSDRLREDQFGYSSVHFIVTLPEAWLSVPTMSSMQGLRAEIQVRTTAQHIWAAASHTLQYKNEATVPVPIRRAIHRVSALLETVDLEFDRVLQQREAYRSAIDISSEDEALNVDLVERVLDSVFQKASKEVNEPYAEFLRELTRFEVTRSSALEALMLKHREKAMAEDRRIVDLLRTEGEGHERFSSDDPDRIVRGVFYSHVGLGRFVLECEFGAAWRDLTKIRKPATRP
jgi:putative GTP pyrophosphokinase